MRGFLALFNPKATEINGIVTYDDKLLKKRFDKFSCFDGKKITEPQNASFKYVDKLDDNYNTFGKERNFTTSLGTTVKVSGGDYGWLVYSTGEVKDLIVAIKGGQTITKVPRYTQKIGRAHV